VRAEPLIAENLPSEPARVKAFAQFFKRYMSVSSVVASALPIPITSFQLIPTYKAERTFLSVYTSLFCFLLLAFIFYSRHGIAKWTFARSAHRPAWKPRRAIALLPLALILLALTATFAYHLMLQESIADAETEWAQRGVAFDSSAQVLDKTDYTDIPHALVLFSIYLVMFLSASAAFILMALREYLQDVLRLRDEDILEKQFAAAHSSG